MTKNFTVIDGSSGTQDGLLEPFYYIEIKAPNLGGRALFSGITDFMTQFVELLESGTAMEVGITEMTREAYDALPNLGE